MAKEYRPKYFFIVPVEKRFVPEVGKVILVPRVPRGGYSVIAYLENNTKALIRPSKTVETYLLERKYAKAIPIEEAENKPISGKEGLFKGVKP